LNYISGLHLETLYENLEALIPPSSSDSTYKLIIQPLDLALEESLTVQIYRIIQELIANSLKHASAKTTAITISASSNGLTIAYIDNGNGAAHFIPKGGYSNLQERVNLFKGSLNITTEQEKGFKANIHIPNVKTL